MSAIAAAILSDGRAQVWLIEGIAPHIHIAMRDTVSRAELRRVLAATYHQVWWPDITTVRFDSDELPVWDEQTCTYVDPYTGEVLPTWDEASAGL